MEWHLTITFATITPTGVLLYSGEPRKENNRDFFELALRSGIPRATVSLGGNSVVHVQLPDWKENRVNDGEWHQLTLEYYGRKLRVFLDDCDPHLSISMGQTLGYRKCAAEARVQLPSKCDDSSVPCHRFLDLRNALYIGGKPGSRAQSDLGVSDGFVGCIKDLHVDHHLIHFSNFDGLENVGSVETGCQRYRPDRCLHSNPCDPSAKCLDKWQGHQCRCSHKVHSQRSCSEETSSSPVSLSDEESYVQWRLPARSFYPFVLSFEFRTRERQTQVMALEFEVKSQLFLFAVENGNGMVRVDLEQYLLPYTPLADGHWHSVQVEFGTHSVTLTVDHLYKRHIPLNGVLPLSMPQGLYSGSAPSTSYPQRFVGCIRNVEMADFRLRPMEQSKTRPGCSVPNACAINPCPKQSKCVRDWDRHTCQCYPGHVGDGCVDACSIDGVCESDGLCIRRADLNASSPLSNGHYACACTKGFAGTNCQRTVPPPVCPPGWFGEFPTCQQCQCRNERGFQLQCHKQTGACICRPGTYRSGDKCASCECGYGSSSPSCDPITGQCTCSGEATGRRCDRCAYQSRPRLLDRKTLRCITIRDRCPSNAEGGVQWPTTIRGAYARQSCPGHQLGIATRKCISEGQWDNMDTYNCTLPELYDIQAKAENFDTSSSYELSRALLNATRDIFNMKGRSWDIAASLVEAIVRREMMRDPGTSEHTQSLEFTENVLTVADRLLDNEFLADGRLLALVSAISGYGHHLTQLHQSAKYLRPFWVLGENMYFAVNRLDSHTATDGQSLLLIPSLSAFAVPGKPARLHRFQVSIVPGAASVATLAIAVARVHCRDCVNAIVSVHVPIARLHAETAPSGRLIQVTFPIDHETEWKFPECVTLHSTPADGSEEEPSQQQATRRHKPSSYQWRSGGGTLIGLNRTHAVCQFVLDDAGSGIFTVLVRPDQGALMQFSRISEVPYTAPLSAAFAVFLCILSLVSAIFRHGVRTRFFRCALICAYMLNASCLFVLQRLTVSSVFCPVRNAGLSLFTSVLFIWLLLYALHIYRVLAEAHAVYSFTLSFVLGVLLPCALATTSFLFATGCSLGVATRSFWIVVGPLLA
ncbi:Cadherin domain containing protein [Aphelenchoides avenae]|nr:Cadherin domain containing protein [Aphelenchus avenae]